MKKFSLSLAVLFMCSLLTFAQDKAKTEPYPSWEIGVNLGVTNFTGSTNIAKGKSWEHFNNYKSNLNLGYGLFIRRNFTSVFAFEGAYNGTTLTGTPNATNVAGKAFKTGINELDLNTVWNMNNLLSKNKFDRKVYWYTKLGVGWTHVNNKEYTNPTAGKPWRELTIPIGTGVAFRLSDNVKLHIGTQWSWVNSNRLDGDNQGGTGTDYLIAQIREQYLYTHAGLSFIFGRKVVKPVPVVVVPLAPQPEPKPTPQPEPKPEPKPVPAPPQAPVADIVQHTVVGNVYNILFGFNFGYDKSNIDGKSSTELDRMINDLKENPTVDVEIAAHADSRGSAAYNMKLSERRGQSLKNYLIANGIASSRINVVSFGETKLTNRCSDGVKCSDAEHAANRRAEATIVVWKKN
ncbi:MAG: OmpA family protein [Prolixibacteraceae bacterium]|jgi:outer membrane protein OmpA-like peptidoglycan-associated protein|nr:OmpA family protein [Prolixibacteraceae bacterium]